MHTLIGLGGKTRRKLVSRSTMNCLLLKTSIERNDSSGVVLDFVQALECNSREFGSEGVGGCSIEADESVDGGAHSSSTSTLADREGGNRSSLQLATRRNG